MVAWKSLYVNLLARFLLPTPSTAEVTLLLLLRHSSTVRDPFQRFGGDFLFVVLSKQNPDSVYYLV